MEKTYAKALYDLASKPGADAGTLVESFISHLKAEGRLKLLPRVLRELKRLNARNESLGDLLEVASEKEAAHAHAEAKALGIDAKPVVNETLVSGWRARTGSRVIDRSGKRALLDLYRSITSHA